MPAPSLADQIAAALQALADPATAQAMRAYQRGQFAFLGVPTPARRAAVAALDRGAPRQDELLHTAHALWQMPARECQYAAIDLLARHKKNLTTGAIGALLALARDKPWWETIDGLAPVIGSIVRANPAPGDGPQAMDRALEDASFWIRRIAMTHQLGWRLDTDQERLFRYARTLAPETEFFIRKAIGWALRDYARWNPEAVLAFTAAHRQQLAPLTLREALKHHPEALAP